MHIYDVRPRIKLPMKPVSGTLISRRVLEKIKLMIIFGIPPLRCRIDLGNDLLSLGSEVFCLNFGGHSPGSGFLLWRMEKDRRTIF